MVYAQSDQGHIEGLSAAASESQTDKRAADPRWRRTRERLLKAGFELIGVAGADGVGIDAIVARAGISKQTFYNHFADRDLLTQALWLESRRIFEAAILRANAGVADPVRRLARGVAIYARLALDDPAHAQFVARTNIHRSLFEDANRGLDRDLLDGVAQGRLRLGTVATAAMFVTGVTWTLITQILASDDAVQAIKLCQETLAMLLRALGCSEDEGACIATDATNDVLAG